MSRPFRNTRCLFAVVGILGSAAAAAWTPYGYGPYGPGYQPEAPPAAAEAPGTSDQGPGVPAAPAPGYPPYDYQPGSPYPGSPAPGPDGYGPGMGVHPPAYPPFGPGQGFPGMDRPGFGGRSGPLQITRSATEDAYIIEIQLGNMKPEEIQVTTRGNWISVGRDQSRQEIKEDTFDQGRGYSRSYSFSSGGAKRRFNVPRDADVEAMSQEEVEGVLRITIPRRRY